MSIVALKRKTNAKRNISNKSITILRFMIPLRV